MVLINYATKEIVAKIVYYGPGLCGKTTNLQQIFTRLNPRKRGKMISLATEADRTLFFDFLPLELGVVQGFKVRFQLYTVPGQVFYSATRKLVLKGADAVVFVADSQRDVLTKDIESLDDLAQNLRENNLDPLNIPMVLQYNKRDLPGVLDVAELNQKLNKRGVPWYESVAVEGRGVMETFKEITRLLIRDLKKKHSMMESGVAEELPPEVFEGRPEPVEPVRAVPKEAAPVMDFERMFEPGERAGVEAGALPDEMETISLSDTAQAEAFLDDVRTGAPADEARVKAEMVDEIGEGIFERELTPDELEAADTAAADMDSVDVFETFEAETGTEAEAVPEEEAEPEASPQVFEPLGIDFAPGKTAPKFEPEQIPAPAQVQAGGVSAAEFSEVLDTLLRLEGELISMKFEVAKLAAGVTANAGGQAGLQGRTHEMESLGRLIKEMSEGQDRLLLSILETVRDNRKVAYDMLEKMETAVRNLEGRSQDEATAPKKRWWF